MIESSRRSFLRGFGAALVGLAAPAIIKTPGLLMPVKAAPTARVSHDVLEEYMAAILAPQIKWLALLDGQYPEQFAVSDAKIGETVRIRLPNDFMVNV